MYTVRVEADFAAAHALTHYHGKCERLHGHNYRVLAYARGEELGEGGMLLDFGVLKGALRAVCAGLDHSHLNDLSVFQDDPSAERIARYIFEELERSLIEQTLCERSLSERSSADAGNAPDPSPLWAVEVYETPTSMARYERS